MNRRPAEPLDQLLSALRRRPDDAAVLHALAGVYLQRGETHSAARYLERALKVRPDDASYWNDLGGIRLVLKDYGDAEVCSRKALALRPEFFEAMVNLGHAQFLSGRLEAARASFTGAVTSRPNHHAAHYNLAVVLERLGRLDEAEASYAKAIELAPTLVAAHYNLGHVYLVLRRPESAIAAFRKALRLAPNHPDARLGLGRALVAAWRNDEGIQHLRQYLQARPHCETGRLELARALEIGGDLRAARETSRSVLRHNPRSAAAWFLLTSATRISAEHQADVEAMEALLAATDLPADDRVRLHFALGKAYDDLREYAKAFHHFRNGNALKRDSLPSSEKDHAAYVDDIIASFPSALFEARSDVGIASDLPVFVVGMPRSGTTLTERIISSHPQAHGAGELAYVASIAAGLDVVLGRPLRYPCGCASLDCQDGRRIAEPYLKLLRWHSSTARRVVDKMPSNYLLLGLIAMLFPGATIIHCRRDPLDTCLSMYFQLFAKGHGYSYDLRALGDRYRQYQRLMAHWNQVLAGRIHDCVYENLVTAPEREARALIDACGLLWDDACLDFHQHRGHVRTASVAQVREPMYLRSLGRWRHYEAWLDPLKEALELS